MTPRLGTDGNRIVYPVRGIVQGVRRARSHAQWSTVAYVVLLVAFAVLTAVLLISAGYTVEAPWTLLALATAGALAERGGVRMTKVWEYSSHLLPTLVAAVAFGPLEAALVAGATMLGDPELISRDQERAPRLKWATYTSTRFMGGAAMGLAAQATLAAVPSEFGALVARDDAAIAALMTQLGLKKR